jgi:hypothetical protein
VIEMAMSEDEILREAARIRAGRRRRVAKTCERCGTSFIGLAQAKYCSDACRMAAARERIMHTEEVEHEPTIVDLRRPGESIREYWTRTSDGPLSDREEEVVAALERIEAIWKKIGHPVGDSTEIIRQQREERSDYLGSL